MRTILIVAGGTGGHIIPAIAFGQWAIASGKATRIEYVCGNRLLEKEIYSHFKISPHILPVEGSPLGTRKVNSVLRRSFGLIRAWRRSKEMLRSGKTSGAFLFGGYISLPFLFACRERKIPMVMHEQNARAGKVTLLASKLGTPIATGWASCDPLNKDAFHPTGTPTRVFDHLQPEVAWNKLNVGRDCPSGPRVFVLGGSLGSSRLTEHVFALACDTAFHGWTFFLLGSVDQPRWISANVCSLPKVWDLSPHFALADLVISRGGGATLSELENYNIPSLIVPWRQASGDHQHRNATFFMKNGLGDIWDEGESPVILAKKLYSLYQKSKTTSRHHKQENEFSADSTNKKLWQLLFESE